jgi:hypothetical protein
MHDDGQVRWGGDARAGGGGAVAPNSSTQWGLSIQAQAG